MSNLASICGIMSLSELDADQFVIKEGLPDGFIAFKGSALSGSYEWDAMIDVRIKIDDEDIKFVMTLGQAMAAIDALSLAAEEAEQGANEMNLMDADGE